MPLTTEQVLSLAPDAASSSAGKKLADVRHWRNLGMDPRAIWGECQGSAVYQVRVDRGDLVAKCSCPSRKFPCKHSLALLLLAAQSESSFASAAPPQWVSEWLDKRSAAVEVKAQKAAQPARPVDEAAQAKREERREERIREGLEALDLWMSDLIRNGLAVLEREPQRYWETQAARLGDAQAPALATRVRRLGGVVGSGPQWPSALLDELGRIALLTEAYRNIERLSAPLQSEVRQLIGWTYTQDEVIAAGDLVSDSWFVIGSTVVEEERFRLQRSWLLGLTSNRVAMNPQFAAGPASFAEIIVPGTVIDAELAFWPGAAPRRALIRERRPSIAQSQLRPRTHERIEDLLDQFSMLLSAQPWADRTAGILSGVAIVPGEPFRAIDRDGRALPLTPGDHWKLAAISGGHPIDTAVEWNGRTLEPLGAIVGGRYHVLAAN
jgi:hypothetical protein